MSHRPIVLALLVALGCASPLGAAPAPLWSVSFDREILWQKLTPTGHLVVSSDEALVGIDPETGRVMWRMEDLKGLKEDNFDLVPLTQYATVQKGKGFLGTLNEMVVIDYVDGTVKWDTEKLDVQTAMGQFVLPEVEALLLYGRNGTGKETMMAVDLDTGEPLWENADFFKKHDPRLLQMSSTKATLVGNQEPLFDGDETMVTFMNDDAVRKWNARTGALVWETEVKCKTAPALRYGYAPMMLDDDGAVLYVPADMTVYAIRTADGSLMWQKPPKLKGMVTQMSLSPAGLLVKGGPAGKKGKPFMVLLDPVTGDTKWKKPFDKLDESTNFVMAGGRAMVYAKGKLLAVNVADGAAEEVAKGLKFKDNEIPLRMSLVDDELFLGTSQNMMLVSRDGNVAYHVYHPAPGGGLFGKIVSSAAIMAINAAATMDAYSRASAAAAQSASGRASASYSLITRNPYMSKRYKASTAARHYSYILTNVETDDGKGPGLVKVDQTNGETVGEIELGDKEPVYEIDEIEGRLFFAKGKKEILCFRL